MHFVLDRMLSGLSQNRGRIVHDEDLVRRGDRDTRDERRTDGPFRMDESTQEQSQDVNARPSTAISYRQSQSYTSASRLPSSVRTPHQIPIRVFCCVFLRATRCHNNKIGHLQRCQIATRASVHCGRDSRQKHRIRPFDWLISVTFQTRDRHRLIMDLASTSMQVGGLPALATSFCPSCLLLAATVRCWPQGECGQEL